MSRRVNVTIPEEVEGLLNWYLRHDERFQKAGAAYTVLHFFEKGIRAAYEEGLAQAPGYDADEFAPLVEHQREALNARSRQPEE